MTVSEDAVPGGKFVHVSSSGHAAPLLSPAESGRYAAARKFTSADGFQLEGRLCRRTRCSAAVGPDSQAGAGRCPKWVSPATWVSVSGQLGLCVNGIHASTVEQLPQWLGDEIWEAELGGEVLKTEPALVAARARLVRHVNEWDEAARMAFCQACASAGSA